MQMSDFSILETNVSDTMTAYLRRCVRVSLLLEHGVDVPVETVRGITRRRLAYESACRDAEACIEYDAMMASLPQ